MVYSDVIKSGIVLPKKNKYTITDYKKLRETGHSVKNARFICICSAIFHDANYSKSIANLEKLQIKATIA